MTRVLVLAVVCLAAEALACSCRSVVSVFPPSRSGVPTNVEFQVTTNIAEVPSLQLFADDQGVPLEVIAHHAGWVTLRPTVPLQPRTRYDLSSLNSDASGFSFFATYTTADGPDEVPPAPRAIASTSRRFIESASTCGNSESLTLKLSVEQERDVTALVVFTGDTTSALSAEPSTFSTTGVLTNSLCDSNYPLQGSPNLAVAVRVIDFAGNLSELSEAKQAKSGGCSAAPALLGVLGLSLLLRRRR
jgi:hypothetical protein